MGVDDWITGVELVGVGVVVGVIGVELDVVGRGEDVVIRVEEVEGLGVKEEVEATEEGLLLAIELVDGGLEVLVGDDGGEEVVGTPVFVLEVELVDIVNCLLKTSFLGRPSVAMSAKRNLIMGVVPPRLFGQNGASYLKPGSTYANAAATQRVLVVKAEATMFRVWKERRTCSWRDCCFAFTGGLTAGDRWADG